MHELISYIKSLLRPDAYDESCLERLIDETARSFLTLSFTPLLVMQRNSTANWMLGWDVAIFIEALEEAFPLNARDRHLGSGQRWIEVALCHLHNSQVVRTANSAKSRSD